MHPSQQGGWWGEWVAVAVRFFQLRNIAPTTNPALLTFGLALRRGRVTWRASHAKAVHTTRCWCTAGACTRQDGPSMLDRRILQATSDRGDAPTGATGSPLHRQVAETDLLPNRRSTASVALLQQQRLELLGSLSGLGHVQILPHHRLESNRLVLQVQVQVQVLPCCPKACSTASCCS